MPEQPAQPTRPKRPRDVNELAVTIAKIATEEIEDTKDDRDPAAVELGQRGGRARAANMTAEARREAAKRAISARWASQSSDDR